MCRRIFSLLVGVVLAVLFSVPGYAQDDAGRNFPNRPIRIIVGQTVGGGNDLIVRVINGRMSEGLGQPVIVENKPGAEYIIAAEYVAKSRPDGYTILMGASGPLTINPAIYSRLPYSPLRDFAPISMIGQFPLILAAAPLLPVRSVKELVEYAKENPAQVNYASSASPFQLAAELFKQKTGTAFVYIPYKGAGDMTKAVMSGEVTMAFSSPPPISPMLRAGRVRGLAVTSATRHPSWPDLPTMAEAGIPDMVIVIWMSLVAPAATPPIIVKRLQEEVARVVKLPDVHKNLSNLGIDPMASTSEELGRIIAADIAQWTAVAKAANIKAD